MSQTQDTQDSAAAPVDIDRVPRPDYKKDAGALSSCVVCHIGSLIITKKTPHSLARFFRCLVYTHRNLC